MYALAGKYEDGKVVRQNLQESISWMMKAAKKGHLEAQNGLAVAYENGRGVEQDPKKALQWYEKAADLGSANAQTNLGYCHHFGKFGLRIDLVKAAEYYKAAAEPKLGNFGIAQYNYGYCLENGIGVDKNVKEAIKWYRRGAAQNNPHSKDALTRLGVPEIDEQAEQNKTAESVSNTNNGNDVSGTPANNLHQEL